MNMRPPLPTPDPVQVAIQAVSDAIQNLHKVSLENDRILRGVSYRTLLSGFKRFRVTFRRNSKLFSDPKFPNSLTSNTTTVDT